MRVLTAMANTSPPAPLGGDQRIRLWVPTLISPIECILPNTGWSLLYDCTDTAYLLLYLCETPAR